MLLALPLAAHDLFLLPASFFPATGERITVWRHNGDSFPSSSEPPALARLRDAVLVAPNTACKLTGLRIEGRAAEAVIRWKGTLILEVRTLPHRIAPAAGPVAFASGLDGVEAGVIIAFAAARLAVCFSGKGWPCGAILV